MGFPIGVTSGVFDSILDLLAAGSYNPSFITANGGTPASADAALEAGMLGGKSPEECLRLASAVGASCVRVIGTTAGVFTRRECDEFLAKHELAVERF